MTREILFRGKRIDNGEWVEGFYFERKDIRGNILESIMFEDAYQPVTNGRRYVRSNLNGECFNVDPETVGQYTGLVDKNGKKIFEGDIVKTSKFGKEDGSGKNYAGFERFCVEFSEGGFHLMNEWRRFNLRPDVDMEVVGNIHDISEEE